MVVMDGVGQSDRRAEMAVVIIGAQHDDAQGGQENRWCQEGVFLVVQVEMGLILAIDQANNRLT